ncbi:MAG: GrpB family protein, partial [Candidatus Obscuribacter sp.]|nr:GrpB family protein [Candidatus Obscuribacter sp.]
MIRGTSSKKITTLSRWAVIVIQKYNPLWADQYEAERERIKQALGPLLADIDHIGSTSVPGLAAK